MIEDKNNNCYNACKNGRNGSGICSRITTSPVLALNTVTEVRQLANDIWERR